MLVIVSDLQLTDGNSGETIRPGAFCAVSEHNSYVRHMKLSRER